MARITRTIEIKAPPEKVFALMLSEKMNDLVQHALNFRFLEYLHY